MLIKFKALKMSQRVCVKLANSPLHNIQPVLIRVDKQFSSSPSPITRNPQNLTNSIRELLVNILEKISELCFNNKLLLFFSQPNFFLYVVAVSVTITMCYVIVK